MHIPAGPTTETELLSFSDALAAAEQPRPDYDVSRWLYVPPVYQEYRYILGTRGQRPLICLGVNPSTAVPGALDNTLQSVERIARGNGFDSFLMLNVYAQRATRPQDMERTVNEALHRENLAAFAYCLSLCPEPPTVWAAWGAVIEKRPYLRRCVRDMADTGSACGAQWVCAGKRSKNGHPHHPLYLPKASTLEPFDVEGYCQTLQ